VHTTIAKILPLAEVERAFAMSRAGHVRGKVVLDVEST
jgi:NADPH:quinone reductase-like Zn-dependent oxidoreductase